MTDDPLATQAAAFAAAHIAPRDDLATADTFPPDLWRALGEAGLLGLEIGTAYGGRGASPQAMIAVGEALVREGRSLGVASAVLSHNTIAAFLVEGFGSEAQRRRYLPEIARGTLTASVAISELGAGAHPKRLKTEARREGDRWVIDGSKAYVTNGPLAGLFIVLALTAVEDGRKRYTAFLVPADAPGLARTEASGVDFLKPAGHCGLALTGCAVPADAVLGEPGRAYETMAIPLRSVEDVLGLGGRVGGMALQLELLAEALRPRLRLGDAIEDDERVMLGGLCALHRAVAALAAQTVDAYAAGDPAHADLLLAVRALARQFQPAFQALAGELGLEGKGAVARITRDMVGLASVATYVDQAKLGRIADRLLTGSPE